MNISDEETFKQELYKKRAVSNMMLVPRETYEISEELKEISSTEKKTKTNRQDNLLSRYNVY